MLEGYISAEEQGVVDAAVVLVAVAAGGYVVAAVLAAIVLTSDPAKAAGQSCYSAIAHWYGLHWNSDWLGRVIDSLRKWRK